MDRRGPLRVAQIGAGSIAIPPPAYGAVEDYIFNLSRELGRLGHSVSVLNWVPPLRSYRARELLSAATLPIELRSTKFDVLHAHSPITAEALNGGRRPYVFTSHSRYWLTTQGSLDRVRRFRDEIAVREATGVVALNPKVVPLFQRIRREAPDSERVACIPFGVDTVRFQPLPSFAARAGVVGLGAVTEHKRFDVLAGAAKRAGTSASIIGPPGDERLMAELRSLDPDLSFAGEVSAEELPRRLASGRVFVHPSDSELASVATIQAMACGLPVVGSDLVDGIVTHGVDGFIVDHRAPFETRVEETAGHLRRLLADDAVCERMGARARETALRNHSWDRIATRISDFYRLILALGPS